MNLEKHLLTRKEIDLIHTEFQELCKDVGVEPFKYFTENRNLIKDGYCMAKLNT